MSQLAKKQKLNNSFLEKTKDLYLDEGSADVTCVIFSHDNQKHIVYAHKRILEEKSAKFREELNDQNVFRFENNAGGYEEIPMTVTVLGVSKIAFEEFLQFFYLERVELSKANISEVMGLITKYEVPECFAICDTFLRRQKDISFGIRVAIEHDRYESAKGLIRKMNANQCNTFAINGFSKCGKNFLKSILEGRILKCSAMDIFQGCLLWAEQMCEKADLAASMENRRQQLDDCYQFIPFEKMAKNQINHCVRTYDTFFGREDFPELIEKMTSHNERKST